MNKVILVGRLVRDTEVKLDKNNKPYSLNALGVKRDFKNKEGKYNSDFIPLIFHDKLTSVFSFIGKGDLVEITGRWQTRLGEDKKTIHECIVETINLIYKNLQENKKEEKETVENEEEISNLPDDLPF